MISDQREIRRKLCILEHAEVTGKVSNYHTTHAQWLVRKEF